MGPYFKKPTCPIIFTGDTVVNLFFCYKKITRDYVSSGAF